MASVSIPTSFARHPKVLAAGATASYLYLVSLMWSGQYATDGFVPVKALNALASDAGIGLAHADQYREVKRLLDADLWRFIEGNDGGWVIVDLDAPPAPSEVLPATHLERTPRPAHRARPNLASVMGPAKEHGCIYCQSTSAEAWDHVMPRSRGGSDTAENLVPACSTCNLVKGAKTPEEWWASRSRSRSEPMPDYWPRTEALPS